MFINQNFTEYDLVLNSRTVYHCSGIYKNMNFAVI